MKKLIESFRNDRLCVALRMSKRSSSSGESRRGGIVDEAAWEVKKSAGGEECRKRLLTPSSRIDTSGRFVPRRRGTCVIHRECQSVGWSAAPPCTRATCIPYFAFPSCRTWGDRAERLPTDEISMKSVVPLFKVPAFIPLYRFSMQCIKKRASSEQDAIDF